MEATYDVVIPNKGHEPGVNLMFEKKLQCDTASTNDLIYLVNDSAVSSSVVPEGV